MNCKGGVFELGQSIKREKRNKKDSDHQHGALYTPVLGGHANLHINRI
jgi:hypothetical protein